MTSVGSIENSLEYASVDTGVRGILSEHAEFVANELHEDARRKTDSKEYG